ncbi:lamin tail domain-containing protein [Maribacter litopenaei]|uniref:Lamin tail domain-containing protein n=1 Tax=Maribacter litopenaei TaxID=2976127 RepID=A0ABY5Y501_9FLAO|nr:lamin tail domain-containing protein [Maribacter litopenaei]UWX53943.1 lamin tail domain-containing protein [Maribacter litopenaei]
MRKITLLCTLLFTLSSAFARTTLSAGDIAFVGLNTDGATDADDNFAFVLLKDIDAATRIIFTDRGWSDATGFSSFVGDGEFTWTSGAARTAGEVIVLDFSNLSPPAASFTVAGDQLFAIQGSIASPTFIAGLHFNVVTGVTDDANWDGDATSNTTSALPDALTTGDTAVRLTGPGGMEQDNFQFSCGIAGCPLSGTPEQIRAIVHNRANWVSNDDTVYPGTVDASLGTVTITDGETPPTINDITFNQSGYCPGELVVITIDGQLNDATEWVVYNSSGCGVTEIVRSSSSTINIGSRANVDTYNLFVRGEGGTIATPPDCFETSIIVGGTNPEITSLSLNQSTYLPGETVILSVNGSLNDATEWVVYNDDGCGVTEVVRSSSSTINVGFRALAGLYTLYVRGEGDCVEEITCTTIDIIVNEPKPTPIITEIMYNPSSMEDDWEWIEIYNPGLVDLDISGYVIDDFNSVAHGSANIATGIVPAGESVVLYNSEDVSEADFLAAWGFVNLVPVTNWGAMSLNNTGDTIGIWDSFASYSGDNETQANVIEQVAYETTDWPLDDGISSVYLKDLTADNTIGSNWALSTDGGATPLFEGYTSQAAGGNNGGDIGSPGTPFTLASITVLKNVDDDSFADMMFDFSFGGIPFSISENTTEGYVFENLLPGNYEITELVPDGWDLVSINAGAGNNNTALPNGLTVVLEAGENAVVTFNNVYVPIPAIVINEILADPPVDLSGDANGDGTRDASQDEFIEIVNLEDTDIDISGWTISDAVGIRHTFPANTILASNCGAVIFGGGTPTGQFGGMAVQTASSGFLGLNNGGDTVILSDDEATVIATYTYGSEGGNDQSLTLVPDGTGTEPLVPHSTATGSGGTPFSPGTRVDGTAFVGCEVIAPPVITCPSDLTIEDDESTDPAFTGEPVYQGGAGDVTITFSDIVATDGTITELGPLPMKMKALQVVNKRLR